jgi:hypothetical protein
MTYNIFANNVKFWCPWCKLKFSKTDENGAAICLQCGKKRDDGLNQIAEDYFQCIACGCKFLGSIFSAGPSCPNGCKLQN